MMQLEPNSLMTVDSVDALRTVPDVRAEVVARGKALIADPNYPSKRQMTKIAGLLAEHWMRGTSFRTQRSRSPVTLADGCYTRGKFSSARSGE